MVSGLFANLLLSMKHDRHLRSPVGKDWNSSLAAFSFSLYCIHIPILDLCSAASRYYTGERSKMVPDRLWKWGIILGAMVLSVILAFLFSRLTEANTARIRGQLIDLLRLSAPQKNAG